MDAIEHGFKVLRKQRISRALWSASRRQGEGGLRYTEDQWTTPRIGNGPLCVFNRYKAAIEFSKTLRAGTAEIQIWQCDYQPSPEQTVWYITKWDGRRNGDTLPWSFFPSGTVLARAVRITNEMSTA